MMLTHEDILQVMDERARSVCKTTYLQERPNATEKKLREFMVVSLPYSISNKMLGEDDDWWIDLTVVFEIYVADRQTAGNPKEFDLITMRRLRQQLKALFPMMDDESRFIITRPRTVITASSDGNGYHYTRVQAKLTTMV